MKRKLFVPLFLILFVVSISGCVEEEPVIGKRIRPDIALSISSENPCDHLEGEGAQYDCLIERAEDEKNTSICYFFEREKAIDECIIKVALKQYNQSICETIERSEGEDWCYFDFILWEYRDERSDCMKFGDGNCTEIQQKIDSTCNKIKDISIKKYCFAVGKNSSSICNEILRASIKIFCNNFFS